MVANFFIHPRPLPHVSLCGVYADMYLLPDTDALARSYDPEAVSSMQDSDEDLDPKFEKHNMSSMNFAEPGEIGRPADQSPTSIFNTNETSLRNFADD
ncbi:hypothetical protein V8E54_003633 [Elaphomyces granulatus]